MDEDHLTRLKALCDRYEPATFSERLEWSSHGGTFPNDLLPLLYDDAALTGICDRIDRIQEVLGRVLVVRG